MRSVWVVFLSDDDDESHNEILATFSDEQYAKDYAQQYRNKLKDTRRASHLRHQVYVHQSYHYEQCPHIHRVFTTLYDVDHPYIHHDIHEHLLTSYSSTRIDMGFHEDEESVRHDENGQDITDLALQHSPSAVATVLQRSFMRNSHFLLFASTSERALINAQQDSSNVFYFRKHFLQGKEYWKQVDNLKESLK